MARQFRIILAVDREAQQVGERIADLLKKHYFEVVLVLCDQIDHEATVREALVAHPSSGLFFQPGFSGWLRNGFRHLAAEAIVPVACFTPPHRITWRGDLARRADALVALVQATIDQR